MASAKELFLKPIDSKTASAFIKKWHYSGKSVNNSQLHIGVFWNGKLEGALQLGPSMDKRKMQGLVRGTKWHEFIELNRMAFSEVLPRNSESRAIAICMKMLKKHAPHIKWVLSFADATACGDGTIYRASGFVLTAIKESDQFWRLPTGETVHQLKYNLPKYAKMNGGSASGGKYLRSIGATRIPGYQLRYIYFIDKSMQNSLASPPIPFSKIDEIGAGMYKGKARKICEIKERQDALVT